MIEHGLILGIEAAVAGGSLSLCRGEIEIANWSGTRKALRAEDLLMNIDLLLRRARFSKADLTAIAVSAGPGSFTGVRVGIATALGLKRSLAIGFSCFSVLEAMASSYDLTGVAAIPMGRGSACAQPFAGGKPESPPFNLSQDELLDLATDQLLVHSGLVPSVEADRIVEFESNLATALVQMAVRKPRDVSAPIFLSRSIA